MRNPDRIDAILHKLRRVRTAYPDIRFGQLLINIGYMQEANQFTNDLQDCFYYADYMLEECLDDFIAEHKILDL